MRLNSGKQPKIKINEYFFFYKIQYGQHTYGQYFNTSTLRKENKYISLLSKLTNAICVRYGQGVWMQV